MAEAGLYNLLRNVRCTSLPLRDADLGTLQREWAETYGPVVRAVGPFGVERVIFLNPSALQRILVTEWTNYPRVKFDSCSSPEVTLGLNTHHSIAGHSS